MKFIAFLVFAVLIILLIVSIGKFFFWSFRSPGGGLGIFSKLPLQLPKGEKFSGSSATNLVTTIEYQQRSIKIN